MPRTSSQVAALKLSSSPTRRPQPAAGQSAVAGHPFGQVLHRQHRVPRINPPTIVRHYARREDLALNQARRRDPADDLWVPAAVFAIVLFVGGFAFWLGGKF